MSYRLLALDDNAKKMTLPVLRKIAQLAKAGAIITGAKPEFSPSLKDDQAEFKKLVNEVWGGSSKVYTGKKIGEVLADLNVKPDFEYNKSQTGADLLYVHRRTPAADIYWVNNRKDKNENAELSFRVSGKTPEIWHPETGKTEAATYSIEDGITKVSVSLEPNDAVFVVFRTSTTKNSSTLPAITQKELATVDGNWNVSFQPHRGAPATATFDKLSSWIENSDAGIKYFSGTATYTKTVTIKNDQLAKGAEVWLDLGDVKNLAEVIVNGKSLGVVWRKPFRINVTNAVKAGDNKLEIKVTNLWVNRLIGDQQPDVKEKITYTTMPFYQAKSALLPSGLMGPVKIVSVSK